MNKLYMEEIGIPTIIFGCIVLSFLVVKFVVKNKPVGKNKNILEQIANKYSRISSILIAFLLLFSIINNIFGFIKDEIILIAGLILIGIIGCLQWGEIKKNTEQYKDN